MSAASRSQEPMPWVPGSTTVVVLPDTEVYSQKHPEYFASQTQWVADHVRDRNIACMLHLGDIVHDNVASQWEVARQCFRTLDGKVPYAFVLGNHDYTDNQRSTLVNDFFPPADYQKMTIFGEVCEPGRIENSFHLCRVGRQDWIVLALEFGPRDEVVQWADQVLTAHPKRLGILLTHAYLFRGNVRFDHAAGKKQRGSPHEWGNDGEQLWQKLVRKHADMRMVLSGHVATGGVGHLESQGDHGNTVHQIMVDYESLKKGGLGYLRLMEFLPDGQTVQVRSYSPKLDRFLTDRDNQFSFLLEKSGALR